MRSHFIRLRSLLFKIFLWSLPLALIVGLFFDGFFLADKRPPFLDEAFFGELPVEPSSGPWPVEVFALFYFTMILLFIFYAAIRDRRLLQNLLFKKFLVWFIFFLIFISEDAVRAGFAVAVYPEEKFLGQHCRLVTFTQDQKLFRLGMCNLSFVDQNGQTDFSLMYDESGDIRNDAKRKEHNHSLDRKEWVDAVRKIVNHDPNQLFEITSFYSERVFGDFYTVSFSDVLGSGFSKEYGPPPSDPQNHYKSLFW